MEDTQLSSGKDFLVLDIGCGRNKLQGSVGIDVGDATDADIRLDLNTDPLPFPDNSVDFVHSSHSLEHLSLDGFLNTVSEIYRVLKPSGQFFLLVPYFQSPANLANPFHNNQVCFNEHTFRFFSSEPTTDAMLPVDYATPSCPNWGLRYSAHEELGVEFELKELRYFYFPKYDGCSEDELRDARATGSSVVDQIAYHLIPVKPAPVRPEIAPHTDFSAVTDHIEKQYAHIENQKNWLEESGQMGLLGGAGEHSENEFSQARKILKKGFSTFILEGHGLYSSNGLIVPPNVVVWTLNQEINAVQLLIDHLVAQGGKA